MHSPQYSAGRSALKLARGGHFLDDLAMCLAKPIGSVEIQVGFMLWGIDLGKEAVL